MIFLLKIAKNVFKSPEDNNLLIVNHLLSLLSLFQHLRCFLVPFWCMNPLSFILITTLMLLQIMYDLQQPTYGVLLLLTLVSRLVSLSKREKRMFLTLDTVSSRWSFLNSPCVAPNLFFFFVCRVLYFFINVYDLFRIYYNELKNLGYWEFGENLIICNKDSMLIIYIWSHMVFLLHVHIEIAYHYKRWFINIFIFC